MAATRWNLVLLVVGLLAGCGGLRGSGKATTQVRPVAAFGAVEVRGALDLALEVSPGLATHVEVTGDDNLVPLVHTRVVGGTLVLEITEKVSPNSGLAVRIRAADLRELTVSGAARVRAQGLHGDVFTARLSGAGTVEWQGAVAELTLQASGAVHVKGARLVARRARIDLSGVGNLEVHATDELVVHISGAGKVGYVGNPRIEKTISGVGILDRL